MRRQLTIDIGLPGIKNGFTFVDEVGHSKIKYPPKEARIFSAPRRILQIALNNDLKNISITWCKDGTLILSCEDSLVKIKTILDKYGLKVISTTRRDIKHTVKDQGVTRSMKRVIPDVQGNPKDE